MAKNSKKEQQDKDEAKKILAEVNFSDDEMAIAQKLAEEFMRHENPEEYEVAKKEKNNKLFKNILVDLFNFGKKREIKDKLEQIEKLVKEVRALM
ncbi:MAG: hypothetical protein CXT77_03880 [uncultured DHVE6 group euryarchaeote]|nr:MAG: hypothetical protein CXT77_03880 [uncultured DHVE6 group euryarchaeote]